MSNLGVKTILSLLGGSARSTATSAFWFAPVRIYWRWAAMV